MMKVGLTGNMGSGKSTVAAVFECLSIPVYRADDHARKMYQVPEVLEAAVSFAGKQILYSDGTLNRQALAEAAFSDPEILAALNGLIHPLVREDFTRWCLQNSQSLYIIHEAAIIFESGFREAFDEVIHVSCREEITVERIQKRDKTSRELILQRMQFQLPDREKASLSDFVILNDGNTLVIPQVLTIHKTLSERSA